MNGPKISVIVPVYNVEPYLRKCLDSIVTQTYRNLEIILVDDGSPDNCGGICDEYANADNRIVVIHKENGGVSAARNAGLAVATGEWIGFVDSDDWLEPDMYEYLLELAEKYHADVVQCGAFYEENGNTESWFCITPERCVPYGANGFSADDWECVTNNIWNKLFHSKTIQGMQYNQFCIMGEDLLFGVSSMLRATCIVFGAEPKYHYFQRNDSACNAAPTLEKMQGARWVLKAAMTLFGGNPVAADYFEKELYRNNLDICSKIVRFPSVAFDALKAEVRAEFRENTSKIITMCSLGAKDKAKILLATYSWNVYRFLLLWSKKIKR